MEFEIRCIEFEDDASSKECWLKWDKFQKENSGIYFGGSRLFLSTIKKWLVTLIWEKEGVQDQLEQFAKDNGWTLQMVDDEDVKSVLKIRRLENMIRMNQGDFTYVDDGKGRRVRSEGLNAIYVRKNEDGKD